MMGGFERQLWYKHGSIMTPIDDTETDWSALLPSEYLGTSISGAAFGVVLASKLHNG